MAISVLKAVPAEEAESSRLAAVDALEARLEAEEKAERAKLAAEEALQAQREAEEALNATRLAAERAEQAWLRDEKKAERARRAAEDALEAWRTKLVAESMSTPKPDLPRAEKLRMLPPLPEADLRAAGLGPSGSLDVEAHEVDRPSTHEPEPELPVAEERPTTMEAELTCQIAYWRGYRKGGFYARALDEDGFEVALAESPLFKPQGKGGVPDDTDEAVAAHEALVAQLASDGWIAHGSDDTWFGRTFRRPRPA